VGQDSAAIRIPEVTFGINRELSSLDAGWQTFPGHYLLYASSGAFTLEVADRQWFLPPQRAAWVAADTSIHIHAKAPVTSSSILFAKGSIPPPDFDCRVFAVTPLAREMIMYAMRWGIDRNPEDKIADQFFAAVALVCTELAADPEQFWLPRVRSQELGSAVDYILEHLEGPLSVEGVSQAIHVSERTLARHFVEEAHLPCGHFIQRVRMLRAMELLAERDVPIAEVAYSVGFASVSAFNAGFRRFTQETPSQYRKRFLPR
jgi:AraC-like DNA-binding protein